MVVNPSTSRLKDSALRVWTALLLGFIMSTGLLRLSADGGLRISVRGVSVSFDSTPSVSGKSFGCVSHAHSDHVAVGGRIMATRETIALMRNVWGINGFFKQVEFGESVKLDENLSVKVLSSGHVLGSAMFQVVGDDVNIVYTGDINTVETLTTKPADRVDAEVLVIESTYGHPDYVFPPRTETTGRILKWVSQTIAEGAIPAFKAYSIGKSQELIKLFNEYTRLPVVVGRTVARASQTYVENGVKLDFIPVATAEAASTLLSGEAVYIDSQTRLIPSHRKVKWAVVTGWALHRVPGGYDAGFPLSSHADYRGLLSYVEENKPKKIYVTHGFSRYFAATLRRRGYDAFSLDGT
ncbi:MAG: MBL fold metallo-hydrolase [Candidatus Caldarchaeum sp.]|nr:MBL fold metallo-hydrolase [Candidatus Caldarchaeum sp.]